MQTLVLGTAQWGSDYGVTNAAGRLSDEVLTQLVSRARELGLTSLDTAAGYGDAEDRIRHVAADFTCQTKLSTTAGTASDVRAELQASLTRLGRTSVDRCLIHYWASMDDDARAITIDGLRSARADGLVDAIGISAGGAGDLVSALRQFPDLDAVQVPVSVLDQRLDGSDVVAQLRRHGVHIQARSIFLQGVALASRADTPFADHPDVLALASAGDRLRTCLGYVRSRDWIDTVVVAPTTAHELSQIVDAYEAPAEAIDWPALASQDALLLEPWRWPKRS